MEDNGGTERPRRKRKTTGEERKIKGEKGMRGKGESGEGSANEK